MRRQPFDCRCDDHNTRWLPQVIHRGFCFARRSATRVQPCITSHGPAFRQDRQRSWDSLCPSQYSLPAVPGVWGGGSLSHARVRRCSPHAVDHLPCPVCFYGCRLLFECSFPRRPSFKATCRWFMRSRLLGIVPRASRTGRVWRPVQPILPWASTLLSGF